MKKLLLILSLFTVTILCSAQTMFFTDLDKNIQIGLDKGLVNTTIAIVTKTPEIFTSFDFGEPQVIRIDKKIYEYRYTIPTGTYIAFKGSLKYKNVTINNKEYTGLYFGTLLVASEWYAEYYEINPKFEFKFRPLKFPSMFPKR